MYTLAVRRDFIARHHLIGGDWGPENEPHSHHYVLELRLHAPDLNQHGYLVDIVEVERQMQDVLSRFRESMLNDLPEFLGLNPSLEHFARILGITLGQRLRELELKGLEIVLWENDSAWAAYSVEGPVA